MTEENKKSTVTVEDVQNLIKKKDEIEEQIKAYYDVLEDVSLVQSLNHHFVLKSLVGLCDVTPANVGSSMANNSNIVNSLPCQTYWQDIHCENVAIFLGFK